MSKSMNVHSRAQAYNKSRARKIRTGDRIAQLMLSVPNNVVTVDDLRDLFLNIYGNDSQHYKISGYVGDITTYHAGVIQSIHASDNRRRVIAYRLMNPENFNDRGQQRVQLQIAFENDYFEAICAPVSVDVPEIVTVDEAPMSFADIEPIESDEANTLYFESVPEPMTVETLEEHMSRRDNRGRFLPRVAVAHDMVA